jgi:23S rRNA A2030 N6-methylase RlmJ
MQNFEKKVKEWKEYIKDTITTPVSPSLLSDVINHVNDVTKNQDFSKTNRPKSWTQRRNYDVPDEFRNISIKYDDYNPDKETLKEKNNRDRKEQRDYFKQILVNTRVSDDWFYQNK